jgi:putative ABC transport system permease protein
VIGMVGDFKRTGLEIAPRPEMFKPYSQMAFPLRSMRVVVATGGTSAEALAPVLRQAVWEVDRDQPVSALRPLEQVVAESVSRQRFTMLTLGFFAAIALLLGAVGIYGVLSYAVSERTREVGVRMALGAAPGDLRGWIMRQGLAPVLAGLGFGVVAALAFSRLIRSLLFGVGAADPITFAAISALLVAVARAAVWLPARRAPRFEPVAGLRPGARGSPDGKRGGARWRRPSRAADRRAVYSVTARVRLIRPWPKKASLPGVPRSSAVL